MELLELKKKANEIRCLILQTVYEAQSGHIGGSLSAVDILTCLYGQVMRVDSKAPRWPGRDRFVMSKGHATPLYYSTLAEFGFFPKEDLKTFRKLGSYLQGHPNCNDTPGVDMSTGSLGQGISAAVGMALGLKLQKIPARVYVLLGDGELQEGQVWEAVMFAANYGLDNLVVIIDNNGLQCDGCLEEVNSPYPIDEKLKAFRFFVQTVDGHNMEELLKAFECAARCKGVPSAVIARTIKGKGISFMEGRAEWHGKAPNEEQYRLAMKELQGTR